MARGIKTHVLLNLGLAKGCVSRAYYLLRHGDSENARKVLEKGLKYLDEVVEKLSRAKVVLP